MGRIMAIDYGKKRCGIAVTDTLRMIANGLETIETPKIFAFFASYFAKEKVDVLVVGEPTRWDGSPSEIEADIRKFMAEFAKRHPTIEIKRQDERFSSKMAFEAMIAGGVKQKDRRNKATIDKVSATIILQSYLEEHTT